MTTARYLAALRALGLTRASQATAAALGLSVRRCQSIAAGAAVPKPVALLLAMYLKYGLQVPAELLVKCRKYLPR